MRDIIMKINKKIKSINKSFYLIVLLIFVGFTAGCSAAAKTSTIDVYSEITGGEKEEILGTVNDRIYESVKRGSEKEEPTSLSAIYVGGKDASVPEGRYEIFGYQAGIITIFDENGEPWLKEVLGTSADTITVSLLDTDKIHADAGFESVGITKAEDQTGPYLTNGIWEVGVDIEPGTYKMSSEYGHGNVVVFEEGKEPRVYEIIGKNIGETETETYKKVTIDDGQIIRVTGMGHVKFEND